METQSPPDPTKPPQDLTLLIAALVFGVIVIVAAQFLISRYLERDDPEPAGIISRPAEHTVHPTETVKPGWKTFTHNEHAYSIRYPSHWHLASNTVTTTVKSAATVITIGVQSRSKDPDTTLREYNAMVVRQNPPAYVDTHLGGRPALRHSAGMAGDREVVYYLVDGGATVYEISITAVKTEDKIIARDILRTLKISP